MRVSEFLRFAHNPDSFATIIRNKSQTAWVRDVYRRRCFQLRRTEVEKPTILSCSRQPNASRTTGLSVMHHCARCRQTPGQLLPFASHDRASRRHFLFPARDFMIFFHFATTVMMSGARNGALRALSLLCYHYRQQSPPAPVRR